MSATSAHVVPSSSREHLLSGPLSADLLLAGATTRGSFSIVEHVLQPRALGAPMHTHRLEDEFSVVLEGRVGAQIGQEIVDAGPGEVLIKPRGVGHAFWNAADQPARLLEMISPAGFERYFAGLADILAEPGPPNVGRLVALAQRHDVDLDPSSIPRLAAEHDLDLGGESLAGSSDEQWDDLYAGTPPWETGRPQPAFVALAEGGRLTGRVLDVGCGTGENALAAAAAGATVAGVDISPRAIELARTKAAERGLTARFLVADALHLDDLAEQFDVVLDSGTFHVFSDADRARYLASLAAVTRPGGRCHVLCFSDATPGTWGPRRIRRSELTAAFGDGWVLESVEPAAFDLPPGNPAGSATAWLASARRSR